MHPSHTTKLRFLRKSAINYFLLSHKILPAEGEAAKEPAAEELAMAAEEEAAHHQNSIDCRNGEF